MEEEGLKETETRIGDISSDIEFPFKRETSRREGQKSAFDYFLWKNHSRYAYYIRNSRYDEPFQQSRGCDYGSHERISEFDILGLGIDFREDRSRCFDAIVTHWDNELERGGGKKTRGRERESCRDRDQSSRARSVKTGGTKGKRRGKAYARVRHDDP